MEKINDGGPAFPQHYEGTTRADGPGISLRDHFATHAPDVPDDFSWIDSETDCVQRLARWRWAYADAMLKARGAQ